MIYNGKWAGGITCAKSGVDTAADAQSSNKTPFASRGSSQLSWYYNVHYIGYTYNNDVTDSTVATSVDTVFGSDTDPSLNNTRSNIKTYIEDTWYARNMASYTNKLEPSAGYCDDRTVYSSDATSTALTTIRPYNTFGYSTFFGVYGRNANATNAGRTPSLTCPRSTVDLYRYVAGSTGVANELKYPTALLTADEVSFAGSGKQIASQGSSYNKKSFLNSSIGFWLLSPSFRGSSGDAEFYLTSSGYLGSGIVSDAYRVRPAISLKPGVVIAGGDGTATNPWTISE